MLMKAYQINKGKKPIGMIYYMDESGIINQLSWAFHCRQTLVPLPSATRSTTVGRVADGSGTTI